MIDYKYFLHRPFQGITGALKAILDVFWSYFNAKETEYSNLPNAYTIKTATGNDLNRWGTDFGLERNIGETDAVYRERLLKVYKGCGVTKKSILEVINLFLEKIGITLQAKIYEWFDLNEHINLNRTEFRLEIPLQSRYGFVMGQSYIGFTRTGGPRSFKESWIPNKSSYYDRISLAKIKELTERWRTAGCKAKYWIGGDEV